MSDNSSRRGSYGTVVLALIFGVAYGVLLFIRGSVLSGLCLLGLVVFIIALALSPDASARLLVTTFAAVTCSAAFAYFAASSEVTGKAVDYHSYGRVIVGRPVTRQDSPEKFRVATNYKWALSIVCAGVGAGAFMSRRRPDSSDVL